MALECHTKGQKAGLYYNYKWFKAATSALSARASIDDTTTHGAISDTTRVVYTHSDRSRFLYLSQIVMNRRSNGWHWAAVHLRGVINGRLDGTGDARPVAVCGGHQTHLPGRVNSVKKLQTCIRYSPTDYYKDKSRKMMCDSSFLSFIKKIIIERVVLRTCNIISD